jgi:hypothetical protein
MIVKIKDEGTGWFIFDEAKNIRYDTTLAKPSHPSLDDKYTGEVHFICVDEDDFYDGKDSACVIQFVREDTDYSVFFNSIAYLCNDQGKTVDKVLPNKHQVSKKSY